MWALTEPSSPLGVVLEAGPPGQHCVVPEPRWQAYLSGSLCLSFLYVTGEVCRPVPPPPAPERTSLDSDRMLSNLSTWHLRALDSAKAAGRRVAG